MSQNPQGASAQDGPFDPRKILGLELDPQTIRLARDPASMLVRASNPYALTVEEQALLLKYEKTMGGVDSKLDVFRGADKLRPPFERASLASGMTRRRTRLDIIDLLGMETNAIRKAIKIMSHW